MDCLPTFIAYETGYFPEIWTECHIFHFFFKKRKELRGPIIEAFHATR